MRHSNSAIRATGIIGTAQEIQERIRQDADGGVHTHIIAPLGAKPEDAQRTFEAFSGANFQFG